MKRDKIIDSCYTCVLMFFVADWCAFTHLLGTTRLFSVRACGFADLDVKALNMRSVSPDKQAPPRCTLECSGVDSSYGAAGPASNHQQMK